MLRRLAALLLIALLCGCAGMRLVESEVSALSTLPAGEPAASGALFRFERLPSQQVDPQAQGELEAIVEAALAKAALRRAGDAMPARYSVLASARTDTFLRNDEGELFFFGPGLGGARLAIGIGRAPRTLLIRSPMMNLSYLYRSEVSLLLRDLASTSIVFEARAAHEGPWADRAAIYAAMFDAALRDFPQPAAGPRRVRVEIPR
jgi:hypothetical protein